MRSNMEDFIEKIRDNPCLWDVNCVQYRDVARKDSIWESLARDSGMENGEIVFCFVFVWVRVVGCWCCQCGEVLQHSEVDSYYCYLVRAMFIVDCRFAYNF